MDAKVDDWVVTPRRGKAGRDQRALVQRALPARDVGSRAAGGTGDLDLAAHAERAPASPSTTASGPIDGYLYDVVDGEQGDDAALPAEPDPGVALDHPVLEPERWEAVLEVVERAPADAGRPAVARSRGIPDYKAIYYRRPALARCGVSSGNCLGLADRSVRRCVDEGCSRMTRKAPAGCSRALDVALQRSVRRLDRGDLRRRAAVHAARLHRTGMERRRSAAGAPPHQHCISAAVRRHHCAVRRHSG